MMSAHNDLRAFLEKAAAQKVRPLHRQVFRLKDLLALVQRQRAFQGVGVTTLRGSLPDGFRPCTFQHRTGPKGAKERWFAVTNAKLWSRATGQQILSHEADGLPLEGHPETAAPGDGRQNVKLNVLGEPDLDD